MSPDAGSNRAGDGWTLLRAGGRGATGLEIPTIPTGVICPAGPVRYALGEGGEARLLLPLREGENLRGLSEAPSLRIRISTYVARGMGIRFLDLTCLVHDLETVFAEVVDEVVSRIRDGEGCAMAARSTIADFRTLLLRPSGAGVAASVIVGLVAELLLLNRLLDRSPSAWRAWRGPAGERHDFRSACTSLEVKATMRAGNSEIIVNSMEQMEPPSGGSLHLLHLTIEQVAAGLLSVSALGRAAMAKADEPGAVRELVSSVGCTNLDSEEWNRMAFQLESERLFEVRDGFPRLVSSMLKGGTLPSGIGQLTYQIDLTAATSFACSPQQAEALEKKLVGCL